MDVQELVERINQYPSLRSRIESYLKLIENSNDEIELADDAEDRIIEIGRNMHKEVLADWAQRQADKKAVLCEKRHKGIRKEVKKNSTGTPRLGK